MARRTLAVPGAGGGAVVDTLEYPRGTAAKIMVTLGRGIVGDVDYTPASGTFPIFDGYVRSSNSIFPVLR